EIAEALQCLQERGLQSDDRFAEDYVQSHLQRGYGPYKLLAELKQRGVDETLAQNVVYSDEIDWFELARRVVVKKYGIDAPQDFNDRAKRMRFLQQRGFTQEQTQHAIESDVVTG
ncbi:MAG: regulatory protein RecX, partial [Gammaproteobacteria bacterium]